MQEYGIPAVVEIAPSASLADVVFERADREPQAVIMRRQADGGGPPWREVTAVQFRDEVTALAKGLIAAGIGAGDRVALLSRTRYEWTLADYAILAAGAVTVPIYETSSAEQVEWILSDSGARALIAETPAHTEAIAEVLGRLPAVERIWLIEGAARTGDERRADPARPLDSLAADGAAVSDDDLAERRSARAAADLATIIYTSGTTGRPKGCQLTHANMLADVRNAIGALPEIFTVSGRSALLFLPLAHSFARIIQVGCLESGTVLGHTPDVANLVADLGSFQPTFILAVPRVFEKVYNGAELQASASPLKSRIFAAAARTAIEWSKTLGVGGQAVSGRQGLRLRAAHALYDRLVYSKLRAATGGRVQYAVSGGAPLGERLGHFFRGVGPHRAGGLRPHRDQPGGLGQPAQPQQDRHGRAAGARGDGADRRRRRDPRVRAEHLPGLLAQRGRDRRDDRRRRLAAHRRPGRARRRRPPAGDRPEEGHHRHRRGQERGPGGAGGPAARASAGQPVPWWWGTAGPTSPAW